MVKLLASGLKSLAAGHIANIQTSPKHEIQNVPYSLLENCQYIYRQINALRLCRSSFTRPQLLKQCKQERPGVRYGRDAEDFLCGMYLADIRANRNAVQVGDSRCKYPALCPAMRDPYAGCRVKECLVDALRSLAQWRV